MPIEKVSTLRPYEPSRRRIEKINTRINRFKHFTEIIVYAEPFDVISGAKDYYWVDTETGEKLSASKRKEILDEIEIQEHAERGITLIIESDYRSEYESCRRAKDNFYGYALCNDWIYFCTFTIATNDFESDDQATKHYWKLFKMKLQYKHKDIKILAVPERHTKGNIHFHALLGNCDLDNILIVAINPKTNKPILQKGRQVYNLPLWDKGFSTIVKIDQENTENQLKAINYIIGYVTKQENSIGLHQKRYYRTTNLDFKNSQLTLTNEYQQEKLMFDVASGKLKLHKQNRKMKVFRIYN